ncbi:MAG: NAD(P)-binding protein [Lentisphaerae bacterium]|nr:NAD(P)-binding protein [Lentisphaerota bacterium]
MMICVKNLQIPVTAFPAEASEVESLLKPHIAKFCGLTADDIKGYQVTAKSIDGRKKPPTLIYTLNVELTNNVKTGLETAELLTPAELPPLPANPPLYPLVVGTGPAGLLAAWLLASAGCRPVILDRGFDVETRAADIARFRSSRVFNPESNYLIGEGGAGTFSDGKLYTGTRSPYARLILELFVKAGAPPEILYLKRPHVGSDILPQVIRNIRRDIQAMGGKFMFGCAVKTLQVKNNRCSGIITARGEVMEAPFTVLAHGLGARSLSSELLRLGVHAVLKGFQIGTRIEHPQTLIDRNQFGLTSRPAFLGAAEYNFVSRPPEKTGLKNVSTFCMCPGGEILPSMALAEHLSTNGMSCYQRDSEYANSCLITTCQPDMFADATAAFEFLNHLEKRAFISGGGDYSAPAQSAAGFVRGEKTLNKVRSSYCFGLSPAAVHDLLPKREADSIVAALLHFDKLCRGFINDGTIIGIETGVSSPVRFLRNPQSAESSLSGLYLAGEGAGAAGGILSAAADGMKIAESALKNQG